MGVGYLVISRPFLDPTNQRHVNSTYSERLEVSMHEHVQQFSLIRLIYFQKAVPDIFYGSSLNCVNHFRASNMLLFANPDNISLLIADL